MRVRYKSRYTILLLFWIALVPLITDRAAAASATTSRSSAKILQKSKCPLLIPSATPFKNRPFSKRTIIAHRGASFSLPEHTLASYRLALELGADYIEPDLVSTRDGVLIAMHTMDLNVTTNVAQLFGKNRMSYSKHVNRTGYWAYDFDWSEIQTLTVRQRVSNTGARSLAYDGMFGIPSLEQILELLFDWNTRILPLLNNVTVIKKRAGLYAELKYPEWLQQDSANLLLVDLFLDQIKDSPHTDYMWQDDECLQLKFDEYLVPPLVVQSFDGLILKEIKTKWKAIATQRVQEDENATIVTPPMVLSVDAANCWLDDFWFHVGEWTSFLNGIGPDKACLLREEARPFINRAREHELAIHPWTTRGEIEFCNASFCP